MGLLLDPVHDDGCLTEIGQCMPRRVGQRHEHLPTPPLAIAHVVLDDRKAAGQAMFRTQPVEHALGRVTLPTIHILVAVKPGVDDLREAATATTRCAAAATGPTT